MSKLLVNTSGQFELHPGNGDILHANRPSVITRSGFIEQRIAYGQVQVLHAVSDTATDEEFAKAFAEAKGDEAAAVKAFMAKFGPKPAAKPSE